MQLELIIKLLDFNWLIIIRPANVPMQNKIITGVRLLLNNKSDAKPLTKDPKNPPISKKIMLNLRILKKSHGRVGIRFPVVYSSTNNID